MYGEVMNREQQQLNKVLHRALDEAGALIKRSIHKIRKIRYKDELSLLTEFDTAAEAKIIRIIKKEYPDHAFLAEESAPQGQSEYKWIIDPIDGTTNFAHTFPLACVSIALEKRGKLILGGVYNPFYEEKFHARKGEGAWLNRKRIRVSKVTRVKEALMTTGFPYDRKINASYYLKLYREFMVRSHGIRRTGSAALDICHVACGRFDGFWELKLNPWDVAAGVLIAKEAGAKITRMTGEPYSIYDPQVMVSNSKLHAEMVRILKPHLKKS